MGVGVGVSVGSGVGVSVGSGVGVSVGSGVGVSVASGVAVGVSSALQSRSMRSSMCRSQSRTLRLQLGVHAPRKLAHLLVRGLDGGLGLGRVVVVARSRDLVDRRRERARARLGDELGILATAAGQGKGHQQQPEREGWAAWHAPSQASGR